MIIIIIITLSLFAHYFFLINYLSAHLFVLSVSISIVYCLLSFVICVYTLCYFCNWSFSCLLGYLTNKNLLLLLLLLLLYHYGCEARSFSVTK